MLSGNRVLTLAETVRRADRDEDILRGTLSPGARLDEIGLAKRFNLSRTPVRERRWASSPPAGVTI